MNFTNMLTNSWLKVALIVAGVGATALVAVGSDHIDAPRITGLSKDIADLYVFENPATPDNVVLVMTVDALKGPNARSMPVSSQAAFNPNVLYQFKIDTNGDAKEDQVVQVRFTGAKGNQTMEVYGPVKPNQVGNVNTKLAGSHATGAVTRTITGGNIVRAYAGLTDDPFFIDLADLQAILGGKASAFTAPHQDALAGTNALAIVVEMKKSKLGSDAVGVWATTNNKVAGTGNYRQEDRVGIPAMNTVFIPSASKDAYNLGHPMDDAANYRDFVRTFARTVAKKSAAEADGLANALLPDMLPYNRTMPANFAALNGRRLADDAVDVALSLLFKGIPTLETDKVDRNDLPFRTSFPWLAPSHKK